MNLHEELVNQIVDIADNNASDHLEISMRYLLERVADAVQQTTILPAPHEERASFLQSVAIQASSRLKQRTVTYEEPVSQEGFWQRSPKGRRTIVPIRPSQQRFHVRYAA
ncbi:hypothetical protein GII36_03195 [Candidatus Mycosynbacter amalyticus]|uniref:Uncharacterized protein n=1 Tax=Candidatus Mycosynbacter amalyticus TaxID=2665156 RepID=A0A857MM10_9BACT|nr:hypothetical protein [Candidatus Mycosynbacter amalyticus]QHN42845.1 hypothetical protein GII36_03195 [Candidatus Mycosynbacter amalyticus]